MFFLLDHIEEKSIHFWDQLMMLRGVGENHILPDLSSSKLQILCPFRGRKVLCIWMHLPHKKSLHSRHLASASTSSSSQQVHGTLACLSFSWISLVSLSFVMKKLVFRLWTPSGGSGHGSLQIGQVMMSSVFSLAQSWMHARQNVCRHGRALGWSIRDRQMLHSVRSCIMSSAMMPAIVIAGISDLMLEEKSIFWSKYILDKSKLQIKKKKRKWELGINKIAIEGTPTCVKLKVVT